MGTVIYTDRFERKRQNDMAFALTKHIQEQTMKNRLNGLCGGLNHIAGEAEPIYTTKDMEYEQSRQRQLAYLVAYDLVQAKVRDFVNMFSGTAFSGFVAMMAQEFEETVLRELRMRS